MRWPAAGIVTRWCRSLPRGASAKRSACAKERSDYESTKASAKDARNGVERSGRIVDWAGEGPYIGPLSLAAVGPEIRSLNRPF